MKKENTKNNLIWNALVLAICMCFMFVLVYKAQIGPHMEDGVYFTLMSEHKQRDKVVLDAEMPQFVETFRCEVPELKHIILQCKGADIEPDAKIDMIVMDADTGEEYYHKERSVAKNIGTKKKYVKMKVTDLIPNTKGKKLTVIWTLQNAEQTAITITANQKQGLVLNYNGVPELKTNVIYALRYAECSVMGKLYVLLCVALLIIAEICYVLIFVKGKTIEQFFLPMALLLGLVMNCLIMVHGVPDEPWHIDTAYKFSNQFMFIKETENPYTIYKRQCDIIQQDMLANGVESNSYYQLYSNVLEKPEDTELVDVAYVDSSNIVPDIVYYPAALGITIGRLLGLSSVLTFLIGRFMSFVAYALLAWLAIRVLPFGKNAMGMIAILPIALQQGASASYDAVINGVLLLFGAMCMYIAYQEKVKKREWLLIALLIPFVVLMKSGVYAPMLLLLFLRLTNSKIDKSKVGKGVFAVVAACGVLIAIIAVKYAPTLRNILVPQDGASSAGKHSLYTVGYALKHPLNVVYLYWNTLMRVGDDHLRGLLGGRLEWLDIKVNWIFLIVFLVGILLLLNVEQDQYYLKRRQKIVICVSLGAVVVLVMASMLFAWTEIDDGYIGGLQGRYYLAIAPFACMLLTTKMVHVDQEHCRKIWMTMIITELVLMLQVVSIVLK